MANDRIHLRSEEDGPRIAPEIYGHFAEHLGRCIYGGIWVGENGDVDHDDGIRTDTVDLLRDLDMPVLRWPGGCFADDYHWQDGIGPREERPRRRNTWWTQGRENLPEEPNTYGTEEFLRTCRLLGTEPYLALNVGSGVPNEAASWVEYCNYDGDTEYTEMRAKNGHPEPHDVTYWGVGNENWGCGGNYDPAEYARTFRRFATYLRGQERLMLPQDLELIAVGHTTPDWNRTFLEELEQYHFLDHISVHRYYECGDDVDFSDEQYYKLLARSMQVEDDIERTAEALGVFAPTQNVGIIVDEWGVWHPQAKANNGLEQEQTVRDAISAAGVLDVFNDHADVVTMANLAQTVNVLQCLVQTDEEAAWPTPNYHVFDLYRPHMGATKVSAHVETEQKSVEGEDRELDLLSASASVDDDELYVTLSNRDLDDEREVTVHTARDQPPTSVEGQSLFTDHDVDDYSTSENAEEFRPEDHAVDASDGTIGVTVPPASVVAILANW